MTDNRLRLVEALFLTAYVIRCMALGVPWQWAVGYAVGAALLAMLGVQFSIARGLSSIERERSIVFGGFVLILLIGYLV